MFVGYRSICCAQYTELAPQLGLQKQLATVLICYRKMDELMTNTYQDEQKFNGIVSLFWSLINGILLQCSLFSTEGIRLVNNLSSSSKLLAIFDS
mmetsp:Transcript_12759/g.31166  ORF Transcript_12759/g.31166 Transcript_12759/m.31166 type:complete len:95 (+) Transcript_12759:1348-1632(+)